MTELILDKRPIESSKIGANENAFYLMATLYGEPLWGDYALKAKNRLAWNRYFAGPFEGAERKRLVAEAGLDDLTPLSREEAMEIAAAFIERQGGYAIIAQPLPGAYIDFTEVEFPCDVGFEGFIFPTVSFSAAKFAAGKFQTGDFFGGRRF
jgi:hypothetical protein